MSRTKTINLNTGEEKITQLMFDVPKQKNKKTTILKEFDLNVLVVKEVVHLNEVTKLYRLVSGTKQKLKTFKSGQYIEIKTRIGDQIYSRKYSLCSCPHDLVEGKYYEIIVQYKKESLVSKKIFNEWVEGTKVVASNPTGSFYYWDNFEFKNICAVTNSVGVAPIMSLAKSIVYGDLDVKIIVFNTAKSESQLIFKDEFEELAKKSKKIKIVNVVDLNEQKKYEQGPISISLISKYCNIKDFTFYICGLKYTCDSIINKIINKTRSLKEE